MKKLLLVLKIVLILVIIVFVFRFVIDKSEDSWICGDRGWTRHGEPNVPKPEEICPLSSEKQLVKKYIEENIANLSVVEPVLGGSWMAIDIEFLHDELFDEDLVYVVYEDGHIQAWLLARYKINEDGMVEIFNIKQLEEELSETRSMIFDLR